MRTPLAAQLTDAQRENAIRLAHRALVGRPSLKGKAEAWQRLCTLIKSRSPAAIARLEQERGLVKPS
jgi:hypothetical protein